MNEEEKKDRENKSIFTEEFHQIMFPEEHHYPIAAITVTEQKQNMANVQLIPIRKIIYDQGMKNKIKVICKSRIRGNAQEPTLKILKGWAGPLGKWGPQNMYDGAVIPGVWADIQNAKSLDPIVVKRRVQHDGALYYEVMDGRHRATASLCAGYPSVPAFVRNY